MIYDISLPLKNDLPVWPGDPKVEVSSLQSMDDGDTCNVSYIKMGVHAGTHVDAPHHFLNNRITVDKLNLNVLVGEVYVAEISAETRSITRKDLENSNISKGVERLLLRTKNSDLWGQRNNLFDKNFIALEKTGAEWIVDQGIKLVGIDYLSIAPYNNAIPTHQVLLKARIIIIEGLNLSKIPQGYYELTCLPLNIAGSDGSPARAILKSIEN